MREKLVAVYERSGDDVTYVECKLVGLCQSECTGVREVRFHEGGRVDQMRHCLKARGGGLRQRCPCYSKIEVRIG